MAYNPRTRHPNMIIPLLLSVFTTSQNPVVAPKPQQLLDVHLDVSQLTRLWALDLDVPYVDLGAGKAQVIGDEADLEALRRAGIQFDVVTEDLQSWYAARLASEQTTLEAGSGLAASLVPPFSQGSMGGYWTFDEVVSVLDQLAAAFPNIMTPRISIGTSVEGRELWMVKVSDNPGVDEAEPEVRIDSLHHAREPEGMQASLWFLIYLLENYGSDPNATFLVDERELYFIPVVNPDGYVFNQQIAPNGGGLWRKNRRNNPGGSVGVDLNRNYPFEWGFDNAGSSNVPDSEVFRGPNPASEPEIQAMVAFLDSRDFRTALSIHTFSNVWISPFGYDQLFPPNNDEFEEIGLAATEFNGYPQGPPFITLNTLANGSTIDQDFGTHGTLSWTPEIGSASDGFWPAQSRIIPLAEDNLIALQRTALAAGEWVRIINDNIQVQGDGDAFPEPGETLQLQVDLRNSGLAPSSPIEVELTASSPLASILSEAITLPGLASFTGTSVGLDVALAPSIAPGTLIDLVLTVRHGSRTIEEVFAIEIGELAVVADFTFEAPGNQGWSVGQPNDATTGNWVRVNPIGTDAQPEDDQSPNGTLCWVTGQGSQGGALGENDVDGGSTTLLSPVIDLSGMLRPRVTYWRWFSTPLDDDDAFQVDLSADGGITWIPAETVGPTGPETVGGWISQQLFFDDFVQDTTNLRLRFIAADLRGGSIVEAGVDDVRFEGITGTCPAPTPFCTSTLNSAGTLAMMSSSGSQNVAVNNFTLAVSGSQPNQFGIFFYGPSPNDQALGDSRLCVGGNLFRLPAQLADPQGNANRTLDLTNPPGSGGLIVQGSSWHFQWWYRDPGFGPGFHLSNGLAVSFCGD